MYTHNIEGICITIVALEKP